MKFLVEHSHVETSVPALGCVISYLIRIVRQYDAAEIFIWASSQSDHILAWIGLATSQKTTLLAGIKEAIVRAAELIRKGSMCARFEVGWKAIFGIATSLARIAFAAADEAGAGITSKPLPTSVSTVEWESTVGQHIVLILCGSEKFVEALFCSKRKEQFVTANVDVLIDTGLSLLDSIHNPRQESVTQASRQYCKPTYW